MTAEEIQRLKEIVRPVAERYGVERVSLFGSRARGGVIYGGTAGLTPVLDSSPS